jgi:DNA-binding NarL/FixJ family response regulator
MELDAARSVFAALGAGPDLAWADRLATPAGRSEGVLTARELDVLALVAKGMTNRQIATSLVISEKTVATHIGHIFTKLDLPSRAAATAYAFTNGLV